MTPGLRSQTQVSFATQNAVVENGVWAVLAATLQPATGLHAESGLGIFSAAPVSLASPCAN